jgi:hypothetical protein
MAFTSDVVWEVRTTGANTNGGGFASVSGIPGALQSGGTGYLDIGALQHQDSPDVIAPVYNMVETRYQ